MPMMLNSAAHDLHAHEEAMTETNPGGPLTAHGCSPVRYCPALAYAFSKRAGYVVTMCLLQQRANMGCEFL
jgi:hypothetical protein